MPPPEPDDDAHQRWRAEYAAGGPNASALQDMNPFGRHYEREGEHGQGDDRRRDYGQDEQDQVPRSPVVTGRLGQKSEDNIETATGPAVMVIAGGRKFRHVVVLLQRQQPR